MIKVFYDGKCNLCAREIDYYRKIVPVGTFDWRDITESLGDLKQHEVSLSTGLKWLHVQDDGGQLHIGVDAFILIWSQLQSWQWLARIVVLPGIRQLANVSYRAFAHWRFSRLAHCQLAAKAESNNDFTMRCFIGLYWALWLLLLVPLQNMGCVGTFPMSSSAF